MSRNYMDNLSQQKTMILAGQGRVYTAPDTAVIRLGVLTTGNNLLQIQASNASAMQSILQMLQRMGISDVKTYQYSIDKIYDYEEGRQIDRGYSVRNILEIRTNNIDMAGNIIDSSVNAGANVVELITFDVSNREMYYQQALNMAVMNAFEKAKSISMNLGTGKTPIIVHITENSSFPIEPYRRELAASTPVVPGSLIIEAFVTAEFTF
ncbi:SIMPL domain-containing protein [Sedimentibacter sp. B4]|uniref:SIMPL domain-containing protein n=1 Tax=Sedimentibacter sp. B4 TaxID=304766 RepID=UPI0004B2AD73|nr:SIMPL domain-containing protein [Sedimentibacter sp. B4]